MSLKYSLSQSIAALERIASLDPEYVPDLQFARTAPHQGLVYQDEEKLPHTGTTQPLIHSAYSEKVLDLDQPDMDAQANDSSPKLTFRHVLTTTVNFLVMVFTFVIPAIAVCIIGLAADNLAWAGGRGSQASNTMEAVAFGPLPNATHFELYRTLMLYLPEYYDTQTFAGLMVAGAACTVGGFVVAPLSAIRWSSKGQSVKLGQKKMVSVRRLTAANTS